MTASLATSGYGTKIYRGDGGVGAATKATKTIGTSNQALTIKAKQAGSAGNSLQFGIVVGGVSTAFSIAFTPGVSVVITSATDGSSVATTTVDHAIEQLYATAGFSDTFDAVTTGNGTGVLVAGAAGVLSGGAEGAEIFTTVAEISNLAGPKKNRSIIEVTHMESDGGYREYITSLVDAGEVTFDMNFTNVTSQQNLMGDFEDGTKSNYRIDFITKAGVKSIPFAALVTKFEHSFQLEKQLMASVTLKVTGPAVVSA